VDPAAPYVATIDAGECPDSALYDPDNGYVYVLNGAYVYGEQGNLSAIDGTQLVAPIDMGSVPSFGIVDDGNGYLYVGGAGDNLSVINGTRVIASLIVGASPAMPTIDTGNGYVYVPNMWSGNVSVLAGAKVVGSVKVGLEPLSATYDAKDGYVYVSNAGSATVSVLQGTRVVATVGVGEDPYVAAYDSRNGYVYVPDYWTGQLSVLDGTSVVATLPVGSDPQLATFDSSNGYVYITHDQPVFYTSGSPDVTVIDGTSVIGSVGVDGYPDSAVVDARTGTVYVPNTNGTNVSVINGTTLVGSVDVGSGPFGPVYNPGNGAVYVPNYGSYNVSVIFPDTPGFRVTFSESGLATGTTWSVTLNGSVRASDGTTVAWDEPNGSYPYSVGPVDGFTPTPESGFVAVGGGNRTVSVAFASPDSYLVSFSESGLPAGTTWGVVLNGTQYLSAARGLSESEPNGSYPFLVFAMAAFDPAPEAGTITVDGLPVSTSILFVASVSSGQTVTFLESGLPEGTPWSVSLLSATGTATTDSISFSGIGNGTYLYEIGSVAGYITNTPSGTVTGHLSVLDY
jgi:YVTN family beta-propeller protein